MANTEKKLVVIRDDDANGTTDPSQLEHLYRPFLDRKMPVHLAVIPDVRTDTIGPDGAVEGFIAKSHAGKPGTVPIGENTDLTTYLHEQTGYHVVQHGLRHEFVHGQFEFGRADRHDLSRRLDEGTRLLQEAGFKKPTTFVAPQDKISKEALMEISWRFPIVSSGWYDVAKVPRSWWPGYLYQKKVKRLDHWQRDDTLYLTHPGCILSYNRAPDSILPEIINHVESRRTMVIVSHHWEYFVDGKANDAFVDVLWRLADWLEERDDISVCTFDYVREQLWEQP